MSRRGSHNAETPPKAVAPYHEVLYAKYRSLDDFGGQILVGRVTGDVGYLATWTAPGHAYFAGILSNFAGPSS